VSAIEPTGTMPGASGEPNRPAFYSSANRDILRVLLKPTSLWVLAFAIAIACMAFGGGALLYMVTWGLGVLGITHPYMWGVMIVNFVFWVGIGHAGTLISAILYLVRSRWRTGVYRASEAMTVFAVMTAGLFPVIHLGRSWQVCTGSSRTRTSVSSG
jgi:Ni/Fe-hydrogenase subunit HybB-like protein